MRGGGAPQSCPLTFGHRPAATTADLSTNSFAESRRPGTIAVDNPERMGQEQSGAETYREAAALRG